MDDSDVLRCKWENSLAYYNLPNVEYVHDSITKKTFVFSHQAILRNIYKVLTKYLNYKSKFAFEKKIQFFINTRNMLDSQKIINRADNCILIV